MVVAGWAVVVMDRRTDRCRIHVTRTRVVRTAQNHELIRYRFKAIN